MLVARAPQHINYKILVYEKFEELIGSKIILKDLKKIPKSYAVDVIRYSIKECNFRQSFCFTTY